MENLVNRLLGLAVVTMLAGCGGSSDGMCGNTAACGGNIVGAWKITNSCISVDVSSMADGFDCPGGTAVPSGFKITGNVTYSADMTYATNTTVSGNVIVTMPSTCLMEGGITLTCGQLQQGVQASLAGTPFTSATCSASGSGCACTLVLSPQASTSTGTYTTTAAGLLTETEAGGTPDRSDYCVKGSSLTISPEAGASMMGQDGVSGTITLTKQ